MQLTFDQLRKIINGDKMASEWLEPLNKVLPQYEINTPKRVAAFLAQVGHESGDFRVLSENLNYSEVQLNKVFKKYFTKVPASEYARQPEKIANYVYGGRMGNGQPNTGDGWKYRGGGLIQLTGKDNYTKYGNKLGMSAEQMTKYVRTQEGALVSACLFWNMNELSVLADEGNIITISKKINGGLNGIDDRKARYENALKVLLGNDSKPQIQGNIQLPLKKGSVGDGVKIVQKALGTAVDGVFGPTTLMEVKKFQKKNGLEVNGEVDVEMFKALLNKG